MIYSGKCNAVWITMSYSIGQVSGSSGMSAMSGASAPMPPSQKMSALFDQMDISGQGSITKSQLESAFASQKPPRAFKSMGADALFSQLDPTGTGSVSKQQFVQKMTSMISHFRNSGGASDSSSGGTSATDTLSGSLQMLNSIGGSLDIAA